MNFPIVKDFLNSLYQKTREAFLRFPLSMVLILTAFGLMVVLTWVDVYGQVDKEPIEKLVTTLWLVLPLFTVPVLFKKAQIWMIFGLVFGLLFYRLTTDVYSQESALRIGLWALAFYSLLFIVPRWKRKENNGFWQYLARIFFILVLAGVCTLILTVSLNLALYSIESLFKVSVDYRWYETLVTFGGFLFLPIFVHAALPKDWPAFENRSLYPVFIKGLSFYLLVPVSILYFGILGVYVGKIVFTWTWPEGEVAWPVLYLSGLTFAMFLLSYPWRKDWQKGFFIALLPFLGVYFIAFGIRISEYGLTEWRYLGVLLGMALVVLCLYFFFVKRARLQMMLLVPALLGFLVSFGPWGAWEFPIASQIHRLEVRLIEIGALKDKQLHQVDVDESTEYEISAVVDYLYLRDRLDELQEWTDVDLSDRREESYSPFNEQDVRYDFMAAMGMEFKPYKYKGHGGDRQFFEYGANMNEPLSVGGYDTLIGFDLSYNSIDGDPTMSTRNIVWPGEDQNFVLSLSETAELLLSDGQTELHFSLTDFHKALEGKNLDLTGFGPFYVDPDQLMLEGETSTFKARIYFIHMNAYFREDGESLENIFVTGNLLLGAR